MMYKGLIRYILMVAFLYVLWSIVLGYFSFLLFILALLLFGVFMACQFNKHETYNCIY